LKSLYIVPWISNRTRTTDERGLDLEYRPRPMSSSAHPGLSSSWPQRQVTAFARSRDFRFSSKIDHSVAAH